MSTEERAGDIFTLIPKVMHDIGSISKDRKNEQQRYSFRGIEDFYQAAHPAMIKHGIFCAPKVLSRDVYRFEKTNDQGKVTTWLHVALEVEHRFYAGDGSFVPVTTWGEGLDNSDKATNKAMSGAMKYALIELFCVPTKDVEDADRDSPEAGTRRPTVQRTTEDIIIDKIGGHGNSADAGKGPAKAPDSREPLRVAADLVTAVAASMETAAPTKLDHSLYIEKGQSANLHKLFRDSLKPANRKASEELLHDWLKSQGILNAEGKPSALGILKANFYEVREAAIQHAIALG